MKENHQTKECFFFLFYVRAEYRERAIPGSRPTTAPQKTDHLRPCVAAKTPVTADLTVLVTGWNHRTAHRAENRLQRGAVAGAMCFMLLSEMLL